MSKHTPGSWTWWNRATGRPNQYDRARLLGKDGKRILSMYGGSGKKALGKSAEAKANARLIAAAPEMYETLKEWQKLMRTMVSKDYELGADQWLRNKNDILLTKIEGG